MNNNKKIIQAVKNAGIENYAPNCYEGEADTYAVFQTILERFEEYADNECRNEGAYLRLHVFTNEKYIELKENIKKELKKQGFFGIEYGPETYEDDTKKYHLVFDFIAEE